MGGGGGVPFRVLGEQRLDHDALHPGGARHGAADERDPPAAGQGHLGDGPAVRGHQLRGPLLEGRLIALLQLALEELDHADRVPVDAVLAGPGQARGVEIGLQQTALARRTLVHQPPLDGFGRLAHHGDQGRVRLGVRIPEAQDALDVPAELVAQGYRGAGARLGPLGEVLGAVDLAQAPLREGEADAVRPGELLGEDEPGDDLDRGRCLTMDFSPKRRASTMP